MNGNSILRFCAGTTKQITRNEVLFGAENSQLLAKIAKFNDPKNEYFTTFLIRSNKRVLKEGIVALYYKLLFRYLTPILPR